MTLYDTSLILISEAKLENKTDNVAKWFDAKLRAMIHG